MKKLLTFVVISILAVTAYANTTYAPYKDMTLNAHWDNNTGTMVPESIADISQKSGIKNFSLAFIVNAVSKSCNPSWGGSYPLVETPQGMPPYVWGLDDINKVKQAGGNVIISFGGQMGTYLAQSCNSVDNLVAAYQSVVNTYNIKDLDFDVEGATLGDSATIEKMTKAIASLQQKDSAIKISFTLPVLPTGLTPDGVNLLSTAIANGVKISRVNIMAMDYGPSFTPDQMAKHAIDAATATYNQLKTVYPAATWAMIGITPMVGINDVNPEKFTLADVKTLQKFAQQKGITFLSSWSVNRDHPCDQKWASPICSGAYNDERLQTNDYDFAHAFLNE